MKLNFLVVTSLLTVLGLANPIDDTAAVIRNEVQAEKLEARGLVCCLRGFVVVGGKTSQVYQDITGTPGQVLDIPVTPQGSSGCKISVGIRAGGCSAWTIAGKPGCPPGIQSSVCFITNNGATSCSQRSCPVSGLMI